MNQAKPEAAALVFARAGRWAEAIEAHPQTSGQPKRALVRLGRAFYESGDHPEAEHAFRARLKDSPSDAEARRMLATILYESGRARQVVALLDPAFMERAGDAAAWLERGICLQDSGRAEEGAACLERAREMSPDAPLPCLLLAGAYAEEADRTISMLRRALALDPGYHRARFHLATRLLLCGAASEGLEELRRLPPDEAEPWLASWRYVARARSGATRFPGTTAKTLELALAAARVSGLVVELGVRFGTSLQLLCEGSPGEVHGFDTFEGLPSDWGEVPAGSYSTRGIVPDLGPRARLYPGRFRDSLPPFLANEPGPIRLLHVDCDLYASTATALEHLAPRLVAGSIVVFDEYLMTPTWEADEFRAWNEVAARMGLSYSYLGFGLFSNQAVLRIDAVGSPPPHH